MTDEDTQSAFDARHARLVDDKTLIDMANAVLRYEQVELSPDEAWDQDVMIARSDLLAAAEDLREVMRHA